MAKKNLKIGRPNWATRVCTMGLLLLLVTTQMTSYAASETVPLNTLINDSTVYDGQTVHVKGEALLEPLERSKGVWVNINDGTNAIGIFMSMADSKNIQHYGNYHQKGDVLDLHAVFHRSCKEHGGDLDLHLVSLNTITPGMPIEHPIDPKKVAWTGGLVAVAVVAILYYRKVNRTGR